MGYIWIVLEGYWLMIFRKVRFNINLILKTQKRKWHSFTIWLHNMDVLLVVQFGLQSYLFREYNLIFINIIQMVDDYESLKKFCEFE